MTLLQQLKLSLFYAPLSLKHIRAGSLYWALAYLLVGGIVFGSFIAILQSNSEAIVQFLLDYFFPTTWHELSKKLLEFLYESQGKIIVGNIILGASLVLASIFLFPIKEAYSARYEKESGGYVGPVREFPLLMQAWEELKLLLLYITAQLVILWLGYYPIVWLQTTAIFLSYTFLFFTFGLDFISPTLQRHKTRYSLMIKVLLRHPILVISFGALLSLPAILLSQYLFTIESLTLIETAGILFISNLFLLALAIPAGTYLAWQLMPAVKRTLVPRKKTKIVGYSLLIITFLCMSFLHGRLINSLHLKSQILKAEYTIDWDSFDFNLPSFDALLSGKSISNLSIELEIKNPTTIDILIEESYILIEKEEQPIANMALSGFSIPAGETRRVTLALDSVSDLSKLKDLNSLLENWRVDLTFELWPGIPFTINIVET